MQAAHAALAARGEWVTNEKRLLERAGLRGGILAGMGQSPAALEAAIAEAQMLLLPAV